MNFHQVLEQVRERVRTKGRVTYRALKREFTLDDEYMADLAAELIKAERVAKDEDGEVLVWTGLKEEPEKRSLSESETSVLNTQPPASYTPQHLAERILAEQQAMESCGSADGERKTITALFADLKGFTALTPARRCAGRQ